MQAFPYMGVQSHVSGELTCIAKASQIGTLQQAIQKVKDSLSNQGFTLILKQVNSSPDSATHSFRVATAETADQGLCGKHFYRGTGSRVITLEEVEVPSLQVEAPEAPEAPESHPDAQALADAWEARHAEAGSDLQALQVRVEAHSSSEAVEARQSEALAFYADYSKAQLLADADLYGIHYTSRTTKGQLVGLLVNLRAS